MAENNETNGHTEAATELEKKIIKQIEVQCKYTNYAVFVASFMLFIYQILDSLAVLLLSEQVYKFIIWV